MQIRGGVEKTVFRIRYGKRLEKKKKERGLA